MTELHESDGPVATEALGAALARRLAPGDVAYVAGELGRGKTTFVRGACRAHVWTADPTGVVHFDRLATLGDLFSIWGEPLGPDRLLSFHGAVRVYRRGVRVRGDPRDVRLRDLDELVLETGPYVPPHRGYRFP